jgi:hypothetical protein
MLFGAKQLAVLLAVTGCAAATASLLIFTMERFNISSGLFRIAWSVAVPVAIIYAARHMGWLPKSLR